MQQPLIVQKDLAHKHFDISFFTFLFCSFLLFSYFTIKNNSHSTESTLSGKKQNCKHNSSLFSEKDAEVPIGSNPDQTLRKFYSEISTDLNLMEASSTSLTEKKNFSICFHFCRSQFTSRWNLWDRSLRRSRVLW